MVWTTEDCEGDAVLLLVRTVEICSRRKCCSMEQELKLSEYSQLAKLATSICRELGTRALSQVCTYACIYLDVS
jgi:ent-copalyl diphosphate synthase